MAYDKLTLMDFRHKLAAGGYKSLGGARKGISKLAGWTDKERDAARKVAEQHFAAAPGSGAALATPVAAVPAPAAAKPTKRMGRPPKNGPPAGLLGRTVAGGNVGHDQLVAIHLIGETVGTLSLAVDAMRRANEVSDGAVNVKPGLEAAQAGLAGAVGSLNRLNNIDIDLLPAAKQVQVSSSSGAPIAPPFEGIPSVLGAATPGLVL